MPLTETDTFHTFLEILKSSNATVITILTDVSRFLFIRRDCADPRIERRVYFITATTQNYLSSLYVHFIIYMRKMQERSRAIFCLREWHLTLLEVLRNNSRKCIHTHRIRELLHVMKLCRLAFS